MNNSNQELRYISANLAEQYYDNTPETASLAPFIEWLSHHLDGIPFSTEWNPDQSGDYDPTRPSLFLNGMYKTYQMNGDQSTAEAIKKDLESPKLTPSNVLSILHKHWSFYAKYPTMNRCIEYCIYCAAEFPDNSDSREEFCHAIRQIQLPQNKDSQRESEEA